MATERVFLKIERHSLPTCQGNANPPQNDITAAPHPPRAFVPDPDELVQAGCVADREVSAPVLEAHQVPRCLALPWVGKETGLRPADCGGMIGQPRQLPHRSKSDFWVV